MSAPQTDLAGLLEASPRVRNIILSAGTNYLGICAIQAPGAWTRVGATWITANGCWICIGPGLYRWGTKRGLAEISVSTNTSPEWHAPGIAMVPAPNLAFAIGAHIAEHLGLGHLAAAAEKISP